MIIQCSMPICRCDVYSIEYFIKHFVVRQLYLLNVIHSFNFPRNDFFFSLFCLFEKNEFDEMVPIADLQSFEKNVTLLITKLTSFLQIRGTKK